MVNQGASSGGGQLGSCKEHGVLEVQQGLRRGLDLGSISIRWSHHQLSVWSSVVPSEC